jgi:hypothetical protein
MRGAAAVRKQTAAPAQLFSPHSWSLLTVPSRAALKTLLLDLCKALPPLEHLRSKCTIQLNHITLYLVIGTAVCMALSICLPLRLLGASDAWQPINTRYICLLVR